MLLLEFVKLASAAVRLPHLGSRHVSLYTVMDNFFVNFLALAQTILVSGDSGSGKTESTKFMMQYLAAVATHKEDSQVCCYVYLHILCLLSIYYVCLRMLCLSMYNMSINKSPHTRRSGVLLYLSIYLSVHLKPTLNHPDQKILN